MNGFASAGAAGAGAGARRRIPVTITATTPATSITVRTFWVPFVSRMPEMLIAVSAITASAA